MNEAQQRWEARHREAASSAPPEPASFLLEVMPLLPQPGARSRALDLAAGAGQNAVCLASAGWPIVAVDIAPAALDRAEALASSRGLSVARGPAGRFPGRFSGLLLVEADLERLKLPETSFDLILCFQYLDRGLFSRIERALAPGGMLVYETFTEAQRCFDGGPRSPEHLLRPGELRAAFPLLESLFYREWSTGRALASLLARKPFAS
jgi:SAM-dependent methyltransferase